VFLPFLLLVRILHAQGQVSVRKDWTIPIAYSIGPVLDDVGVQGSVLLNQGGTLSIWALGASSPTARIALQVPASDAGASGATATADPGPFKFSHDGRSVIGIQDSALVLVDTSNGKEIRRLFPCDESRNVQQKEKPKPGERTEIAFAMSRQAAIAVSCTIGERHFVVMTDETLNSAKLVSKVSRPIQSLAWSPDGSKVAVLYFDPPEIFDKNGHFVGVSHSYPEVDNVSIFDVHSGSELIKFNTGGFDAKIIFSPDGALIYSISHSKLGLGYSRDDWKKETLRAFEATTGHLVQTIRVDETGVRDNFAVSPDGKLIAAESTVDVTHPFFEEQVGLDVQTGFVLLDSITGHVVFRERRRSPGEIGDSLPLFFSPDGKWLVSSFSGNDQKASTRIIGYEVATKVPLRRIRIPMQVF
jgi:WD40 repeat protein